MGRQVKEAEVCIEVSVWCLVADVNAGGRLGWYLPYVFTDSPQTMATGREVSLGSGERTQLNLIVLPEALAVVPRGPLLLGMVFGKGWSLGGAF